MTAGTVRTFNAVAWHVVDGDTIDVMADLDAFDMWALKRFRLLGCNAIEHDQPGGVEAREHLAELLPTGTPVTLTSVKVDKFGGRYDAAIKLPDGTDLVAALIADHWAVAWDGRGPKPVPPWPRPGG